MTKKQAISLTGDLSTTSKMPCDSWGIPAKNAIEEIKKILDEPEWSPDTLDFINEIVVGYLNSQKNK